jgi:hypothetical protein
LANAPSTSANDPWQQHEASSKKTMRIAELSLGTGLAASAFGGATMGVGKAIDNPQGDVMFWIGIGTLGMGIVATTVSLVVLTVAGVQYAGGD